MLNPKKSKKSKSKKKMNEEVVDEREGAQEQMKKGKKGVMITALAALVVLFFLCVVITKEDEYSIVKQFGKIQYVVDKAGISFKLPLVQSVDKVSKATLLYDIPQSDVITSDKKTMIIDCYILYRISDPYVFARTLTNSISNAEYRLNTSVYNATKNVISAMPQEEVISGRKGGLTDAIMKNVGNGMEKYGIELLLVEEKLLDLPDDNKNAVFQRMISERETMAATYTATGAKDSQLIHNETDKEVTVKLAQAQAESDKLVAEGEAEYMRILSEAYNDPDKAAFYEFIISLDTAKTALTQGKENTLILSSNSPIAKIFNGN